MTHAREINSATLMKLTVEQATDKASSRSKNPDDQGARIKLLGYYFGRAIWSKQDFERHCIHSYWFVENAPEHDVLSSPIGHPRFRGKYNQWTTVAK